ncbi:aspartate/glutamate racemase family protein [Paralcaligenes ureilyticus]|uniref:Aspartate racemase n=1 Tax=Paralcaligenes ureilyticus TaxID=627131 RepID=A0A4R3M9I0_9BURK|nr:aspartate/glutamate racemase family protein [Paralcaligenes ureilyticus]TCT09782.1 aspartate racemase [Paralcaligenes ureilyticus]
MRTIGLLGGMSWESTATYYRLINQDVRARLGGLHSAQSLMHSVDFAPIAQLQHDGEWAQTGLLLADAAKHLEKGGADCIVLCTNTMHMIWDQIAGAVSIPFLHIVDPTGIEARAQGFRKVGFLGTMFSMRESFFRDRLLDRYGVEIVLPTAAQQIEVHDIIYHELCLGVITEASRARYRQAIRGLVAQGAEAIVLGCTEIMLLVREEDSAVPLLDTTALHARAAVDFALAEDEPIVVDAY